MSRALLSFTRLSATHLRSPITSTTTRFFTTSPRNMGVKKTVLVEGNGPSPQQGDVVTMLYTGWLKEAGKKDSKGKQFDTTEKPGRGPFKTPIGVGRVIKGAYSLTFTSACSSTATLRLGRPSACNHTSLWTIADSEQAGTRASSR